jgi:hypothetical protein
MGAGMGQLTRDEEHKKYKKEMRNGNGEKREQARSTRTQE